MLSGEGEGEDKESIKMCDVMEARRKEGLEIVGNMAGLGDIIVEGFGNEQVVFAK